MIAGGEKWTMYNNNVRKRSWSKPGEASQMVAKPVLTPRKMFGAIGKEFFFTHACKALVCAPFTESENR